MSKRHTYGVTKNDPYAVVPIFQ